MVSNLIVHESAEALVFQATERPGITDGIVSAAVGFVCVAIAAHWLPSLPLPVVLFVGVLVGGASFAAALRPRHAELRVTNLEYVSRGSHFRRALLPSQRISRADVRWLEYQEDESGPENDHPGGVYAKLKHHSVCVLPGLDAQQSSVVIERISAKFVDLGDRWRGESGFGNHITSLHLDQPESDR